MDSKPDVMIHGDIDITDPNILEREDYKQRRTPIMVTLGDPMVTPVDIQKMMEAGMNVARLRGSHMTKGDKMRLLGKVDKAAMTCCRKYRVLDWPVATCIDLKTCIVRTGLLEEDIGEITIEEGTELILTYNMSEYNKCNQRQIFVDNPFLTIDIKMGTEISISQDEIIVVCTEIVGENSLKCIVRKGGQLKSMSYVSAKGSKRTRPLLTKKDLQIIKFALQYQVDIIIINYARHEDTLIKIKQAIGKKIKRPILISGICTKEGLDNIDGLLKESDGLIISREFLTYELEPAQSLRMPQIQKWIATKCQLAGKPCFLSGGIFQEALVQGQFSDKEIADVSNALLDGVTGFILKDCDDVEFIIETIKAMDAVCRAVEPFTTTKTDFWRISNEVKIPVNAAEAAVLSCATVANQLNARVIVLPTVSGRTAKALLGMRPACIVITVSTKSGVTRLLHSYRCIIPLMYTGSPRKTWHLTVEDRVRFAIEYAVKRGWLEYGDAYVTLERATSNSSFCDTVRIWKVAISRKHEVECPDDDEYNG